MTEDERKMLLADFALLDRFELEAITIGYAEVALDSEALLADMKSRVEMVVADMRGLSEYSMRSGDLKTADMLAKCAHLLDKICNPS